MAVIESTLQPRGLEKSVLIICPICKSKKQVNIPKAIISEAKQLTSISISKEVVCKHHFQAFIDKNFMVRGYQKVDYQLEKPLENIHEEDDDELFSNLILEKNYVEYKPKNAFNRSLEKQGNRVKLTNSHRKMMSLEDIYEEFWEFISEDNLEFIELIRKDPKRNLSRVVP